MSPSNHYDYHEKDHRDRDEILVVIGMFPDEISASFGGGGILIVGITKKGIGFRRCPALFTKSSH